MGAGKSREKKKEKKFIKNNAVSVRAQRNVHPTVPIAEAAFEEKN